MHNFDAVDKTNFAFIAFNQLSGEGIAHGRRAIFALRGADLLEPSAEIEVLDAGAAGVTIWTEKIPLYEARRMLDVLTIPAFPKF